MCAGNQVVETRLNPLWNALYGIYEEFSAICRRHGLRHFALGGTALGAIRHNGFIPWDDDLDVAMPRPDYEQFMTKYFSELPQNLKVVNWKNTQEYNKLFGKIQECRKDVVMSLEEKLGFVLSNGVFIDIFPIDGYPDSIFVRWYIRGKHWLLSFVLHYLTKRPEECSLKGKVARIIGKGMAIVMPSLGGIKNLLKIYDKDAKWAFYDDAKLVSDVSTFMDIFHRRPQLRTSWGNGTPHPFFGKTIMMPDNPHDPLCSRYGETYMVLPPVEKQHPTHTETIHHPWWLGPTM